MLIQAKVSMEQVTQEMIEELAANVQLLAVDHRQRAADYRQKGRKKEVPEAKINRAFDEFIEVLREGIEIRSATTALFLRSGNDRDAKFVLSQLVWIEEVLDDVVSLRESVFPEALEDMEETWGADALMIYGSFKRCLGFGSMSKNGPACRFISLALKRIGWLGELSPASVEGALTRRRPTES
jgi:hypothetical protein